MKIILFLFISTLLYSDSDIDKYPRIYMEEEKCKVDMEILSHHLNSTEVSGNGKEVKEKFFYVEKDFIRYYCITFINNIVQDIYSTDITPGCYKKQLEAIFTEELQVTITKDQWKRNFNGVEWSINLRDNDIISIRRQ